MEIYTINVSMCLCNLIYFHVINHTHLLCCFQSPYFHRQLPNWSEILFRS